MEDTVTKKHFEKAAEIVQAQDAEHRQAVQEAMEGLCAHFGTNFNRERFRRACQPGANVRARS